MAFGDGLKVKEGCKVCAFLDTLGLDERVRAADFFADSGYSNRSLAKEMNDNGHPVDKESVRRHRINHVPGWVESS